jgi:MFS family permease
MKQVGKLSTFFSLYLAQAVPLSLFSTLLPVLMRQDSFSLSAIGLLQLIKLPWILKFFWAPLVDHRTTGLRAFKHWIIGSELVYALLILAVAFLDLKLNFTLIFVLMLLSFVASATQDIATDALAALSFNRRERGRGNSMQSMGSFAGAMIGGGLLMLLFKQIGWMPLFIGVAVFLVLAIWPIARYRDADLLFRKVPARLSLTDLGHFFRQKGAVGQLLFLVLVQVGVIGILAMYKPFLVDHGFELREIGVMFGLFGPLFGVLSSFAGGYLLRRYTRYRVKFMVVVLVLMVPLFFGGLTLVNPDRLMLYVFVAYMWTAYGFASVLVNTVAMDFVRAGREGTDFTLQTVLVHLSSMLMAVLSGKLAQEIGYSGLSIVEAGLAFFSLFCLIFWGKTKEYVHD